MTDEEYARQMAQRLQQVRPPVCPQMRKASAEWLYPVEGYCVLERSPGWLMIPSIEEYRSYCTTPRFHECPWFGGGRDSPREGDGVGAPPPIRRDVWRPPDAPHSSADS